METRRSPRELISEALRKPQWNLEIWQRAVPSNVYGPKVPNVVRYGYSGDNKKQMNEHDAKIMRKSVDRERGGGTDGG